MRFTDLNEGPNDPGIFRAIFLAGGPGSGKSYAANELNLYTHGMRPINSDTAYEFLMQKYDIEMTPGNIASTKGQDLRHRAKQLTDIKKQGFLSGRLGVVIDGTAKDPNKILNMKASLEELGYETAMVFINTTLRTAMQRNNNRQRKVPTDLLVKGHKAVQSALPSLKDSFGDNFIEINSDSPDVFDRDIAAGIKKIRSFVNQPHSAKAKKWINTQRVNDVAEGLDIPRNKMPQISQKDLENSHDIQPLNAPISMLTPSQSQRVPGLTKKTKKSIEGGMIKPLIVDRKGYIVNGHHRYDAYKELGATDVPVLIVTDATIHELIDEFSHTASNAFAESVKYIKPQLDVEWDEAERYPEFRKIGKAAWIKLASAGKAVTITDASDINNTDAAEPDSFKSLDPNKQERALAQIEKGSVELPVIAVYSDGYKELIGGNTRLTAMMAKHGKAIVWQFEVPDEVAELAENFADGKVKGKSRPGRVKRAGASCKGSVSSLRAKAKKYSGEKGKMYHWCANMKAGKKK